MSGALRRPISLLATGLAAGVAAAVGLAGPASAVDVHKSAQSWPQAAALLGPSGSLWEPVSPLNLRKAGPITVIGDQLQFADGKVTAGSTYAGATYGTRRRGFTIEQRWLPTSWATSPLADARRAPVGVVRLGIGEAGARVAVDARVYANCYPQPRAGAPRPVPEGFRCRSADVLRTGGAVELTAVPGSTNAQQAVTEVVITSTGLTLQQLLMVARSLHQSAAAPGLGAGSAEMVALCAQMKGMTLKAATDLAAERRYITRVGTIDDQPQPVTMDFRPDRFTFSIAGDRVVSCTYG